MSDPPNPTEPTDGLPKAPRGRIAPGSLYDTRDQLRLYSEEVGLEAAKRQVLLTRQELARKRDDLKELARRREQGQS